MKTAILTPPPPAAVVLPPSVPALQTSLSHALSKIFIGGLSFETTDEALKRYFEAYGPVADAIVMKDAVSRRSRGFGFITYMNSASVDAALSVKQHIVDNRRVEAKRAVPRSEVPTKVCAGGSSTGLSSCYLSSLLQPNRTVFR